MVRTTPFDETFERMMSGVTDRAFDLDVADYDDELVVTADLPGYDREDIEVAVANRTFTLRASRGHDEVTDGHESEGSARAPTSAASAAATPSRAPSRCPPRSTRPPRARPTATAS
jgi:Molecular chaperone (small heat shock protein)